MNIFKKILIPVIMSLTLMGCYNSSDARHALAQQGGFTDVQIIGHGWFACSKDDFYRTKFTAKNSQGKQVTGVVCSGLFFKNSTIRW